MEGYVGMESEAVAPSTLPATIMLPYQGGDGVQNLIVPTAVSASHVAFSAVRLEPTWMMLGSAAGMIVTLAVQHATALSRLTLSGQHKLRSTIVNPTTSANIADVPALSFHPNSKCSSIFTNQFNTARSELFLALTTNATFCVK